MKLIKVRCIKDYYMDEEAFYNYEDRRAYFTNKYYYFVEYKHNEFIGFDDLNSDSHIMFLNDMKEAFDIENMKVIDLDRFL